MIKQIIWLSILMAITHCVSAQITIEGEVYNSSTNEKLVGATILEKGSNQGTVTDINGMFSLKVNGSDSELLIEYLGYTPKEITAGNGAYLTIGLKEDSRVLDDVVITALGLERSSKKLGYNVQQLDGQELAEVQSVNLVQNLAGKLAGVTVTQGGTGIGSTSKITIRGESSLTNNNPLFVIDGTPINNNSIINYTNEAAAGFQEVDFGNGAMDINAEDVASISVLKGPSAAALYGTRASNGVIIITTKSGGKRDGGLGVSFTTGLSVETPFQLPDFQNRFGQGNSGQFEFVDGLGAGVNDNITYSWGPELDQGTLIPQFDSPVTLPNGQVVRGGDVAVHGGQEIPGSEFVSHPDNLSNFYRTGSTITNHISFDGGGDQGSFRISLADMRNESIIPGSNLNRKSIMTRMTLNPSDRWTINSTLSYVRSDSDNRPSGGYGSENINYSLVAWGPRSLDTEILRDYWQPGLEGLQHYSFNYTFFDNPYFILQENTNAFDRNRVFGNLSTSYAFTDKLSLRLSTGLDLSDEDRRFKRNYSTNRFRNGAYAEHAVDYREINNEVLVNYTKSLPLFDFDVSLGANRLDQSASTKQFQTVSLAQPGIFSLANAASPIEAFSATSEKRINSLFGIIKMGWRDQLFVELTGRNDWSSALATPTSADNTSFFYPSVSVGYVLSEAFNLPSYISFATVRASYAQVGNDTSPYQTSGVFEAQTNYNSQPTFSAQDLIANNSLLPEQTTSYEIGTDIRWFDDRVSLDLTYYNALTENQIIALPVAISSGYTERVINGGEVRSKGVEALLGLRAINNDNFKWSTYFNFSKNKTTIESLPEEIEGRLTLSYSRVYDNVNQTVWHQVEKGGQVGDLYGTGYSKNENGDFIIGADGRFIADNSLIKLGNYNPDFVLGWSNDFSYKNWSVGALFDWRQGGILVSRTQALAGVAGQLAETVDRPEEGIIADGVVNVGSVENPQYVQNTTPIPAETYYRQFYDRNHEENNTYDASYFKIRELSLTYRTKILGKYTDGGKDLRITLTGRNLFAFSEIPHFDPEQIALQGNSFISGVEDMSYASSRSIGIKLNIQL